MPTTRTTVLTTAFLAALALAGCGSDDAAPPGTSSPGAGTTSASEGSRSAGSNDGKAAITAVEGLEARTDELRTQRKKLTSDDLGSLGEYATETSYDARTRLVRDGAAKGRTITGAVKVTDPSSTRRDASTQIVTACVDLSDRRVVEKDGAEVALMHQRSRTRYTVVKGDDGGWRVSDEETSGPC